MKDIYKILMIIMIVALSSCEKKDTYRASADKLLITSIQPTSGFPDDIIFINGKNFSSIRTENKVSFNGVEAVVLESSPSQLQVVVPKDGVTGAVRVVTGSQEEDGPVFTYTEESDYFVTTIVGSGTAGFADGIGTAAKFNKPSGVVMDANGNLIITDQVNNSIRKMTPAGVVTTIAGIGGSAKAFEDGRPGRFNTPWQSTIDPFGNIIVVEKEGGRIRKIATDGTVSTLAGPTGAVANRGFADGAGSAAKFDNPLDAVSDAAGNIYVADRDNKRIRKITPAGVVSTFAGDGTANIFENPISLAIDPSGNIYVADKYRIKMITPAGAISVIAGTGAAGYSDGTPGEPLTATLGNMFGLTMAPDGYLIIADDKNIIRTIVPGTDGNWATATVKTIAGIAGQSGKLNGAANTATFYNPYDVTVDASGNIFVGDVTNHQIRRISNK